MKKHTKIILIVAAVLVLLGVVIGAIAIAFGAGMDKDTEKKTKYIDNAVTVINIDVNIADINMVTAKTDRVTIKYTESSRIKYDIWEKDGVLSIISKNNKNKWFDSISFNFSFIKRSYDLYIEVPEDFAGKVNVLNNLGNIDIERISGDIDMQINCGDVDIKNCTLGTLSIDADLGNVDIERTSAQSIVIDMNCGDIDLENVTAPQIDIENDLGDIKFERLSGDRMTFRCSCGDIKGTVTGKKSDYQGTGRYIDADTDLGDVKIKYLG